MTLTNQVLNWLRANPRKCINADEIADYFSVSRAKVATQLAFAVREGELALDPLGGEDSEPVWYLPKSDWAAEHGHCTKGAAEHTAQAAAKATKPASQPTRAAAVAMASPFTKPRYTPRDFSALEIEDDVPLEEIKREEAQYVQLLNLFKKMKPGQSVLIPQCNAVRHATSVFHRTEGQRVTIRKIDAQSVRVWRTE